MVVAGSGDGGADQFSDGEDGDENDNSDNEDEDEDDNDNNALDPSVPMTAEYQEKTRLFVQKVKRMCELEDEIKDANAQRKIVVDEKNELRKEVIAHFLETGLKDVTYLSKQRIYIEEREVQGSLTRKTLFEAIKTYYDLDGVMVTRDNIDALDAHTADNTF